MEKTRNLRAQKHIWRHMMIISFIFYEVIVGHNEALVNKIDVLVNDTVYIHCHRNASIDIQWHFNSFLNYVFAGGKLRYSYRERFRTEDDKAGSHTLIIPNVRSEDAGVYYCQEEISGRLISSTHLTVIYSDPVCSSNMHPNGFIGPNTCTLEQENIVFNCVVSFNASSPPHLIWRLLNDNRTINNSICEVKPNRRNCSLILKSDPKYDGSIFICQTAASIGRSFNCSTETIKILYFFSTNDTAKKNVNDNVNCSANSNLNVKYNWTFKQNNKTAFLSSKQNLLIQKPGIYQCEVNYSIRNYSCLSLASVLNASVESTNGGSPSETTALVIAVSIGFILVVLALCTGMFIFLRMRRKWKRENRREEFELRENERRENERRHCERRDNESRENQRIRNKIEGMYKDFVLEVDPKDVLELLIQKSIISNEEKAIVLDQETKEDSCRVLLDHLFSSSHREAYIVLRKALRWNYPMIVARIDATDVSPVTTIRENERLKDKLISIYMDFTSEVDPKNIKFDLLIQSRIVSIEDKQRIMNKDTAKERCRALIDHLFLCSKENAFLVLREALEECYPKIVKRIDVSCANNEADDETVTDENEQENERIRNRVVAIYEDFVSEVDPKKVLDFLIQNKIVNIKQGHNLKTKGKTEEQCEALLDLLYSCSKDNVFIILKEAVRKHYPVIVERIDSLTIDDKDQNNSNRKSKMRLESSIIVFGEDDYTEIGAFKINLNRSDEVSALQQLPFEMNPGMAAAVYCGSVFVTGIGTDEIWRFDAKYSKWNKRASLIRGRLCPSVAFVDHILYLCGGWGLYGVFDDVEAYDTIDDKCFVAGKLNYAVEHPGNCVPHKVSLYIFGGLNAQYEKENRVQVYNTKLNSCTILTNPMPRNEAFLRAALLKNYVILLGEKSCFMYNFDTETWTIRDQFKTDIYWFGVTVHNEKLFVIGGNDSNGIDRDDIRYVPIVNILNDQPIEWKQHAKFPQPFEVSACGKFEFLVKQI